MTDQHASRPRRFTVIQGAGGAASPTSPRPECPPLAEIRAWLDRYGVPYAVHNHGAQVRVAAIRLNYFVHTGTLYYDREGAGRAAKGFAALVAALAPHLGPQGWRRSTTRTQRMRPTAVIGPTPAVALIGRFGAAQPAAGPLGTLALLGPVPAPVPGHAAAPSPRWPARTAVRSRRP